MKRDIKSPIKPVRLDGLPEETRGELKEARLKRGWSQAELGRRVSLPQMHISGIESGKIVPRFDTLLDLVRVLDFDLLMVPRALVPAVQAFRRSEMRTMASGASQDLCSPLEGIGQHCALPRIELTGVVLDPSLPVAA